MNIRSRTTRIAAGVLLALTALTPAAGTSQSTAPAPKKSENGRIQIVGTIIDILGKPVPDFEIQLMGTDLTTRSDERGRWQLSNVPVGERVLLARKLPYTPVTRTLHVKENMDSVFLATSRFATRLSTVEVNSRNSSAQWEASLLAERLSMIKVNGGRMFTREDILKLQPFSVADLLYGAVQSVDISQSKDAITATLRRMATGGMSSSNEGCPVQFYLNRQPIDSTDVPSLNPRTFLSVEIHPTMVSLTGFRSVQGTCGAIIIRTW